MRLSLSILIVCLASSPAVAQLVSGGVSITTVYSQNERFYLRSVPFDDKIPTLPGKTAVYQTGSNTPLYTLDRAFDYFDLNTWIFLSNDGDVIFYVVGWEADEKKDGLHSINVYKKGQLIRSFTETEITGCDENKEKCTLVYSNFEKVIDLQKSQAGGSYKRVFKDGVDEKERFLNDFAIFNSDDVVYLTDYKKRVHTFDLKDGRQTGSDSVDNLFEIMKAKARLTKTELEDHRSPGLRDFPRLQNGADTRRSLANYIGMTAGDSIRRDDRYRWYNVNLSGYYLQDGTVEIESIEADNHLPKDKILEFFRANRFDTRGLPKVFDKWYFDYEYFSFRNTNTVTARQERRQEVIEKRQAYEKRLTLERIDGVYIPANLGECFIELDKQLKEVQKDEMKGQPKREDMILYHLGLGTWMRNEWGLWRGSRLSKYFNDHGVSHPESMSSIILYHYHDWLNGKKETWKEWESKPPKKTRPSR
jgi:uncharacterized protein DUF6794